MIVFKARRISPVAKVVKTFGGGRAKSAENLDDFRYMGLAATWKRENPVRRARKS